jgi:nitroreductase/NAD-dependent dihydropyrimidine dehydrogenase PreA subunit
MPIPTSRTRENALITIHEELCTGCGLCVEVCKDFSLVLLNKKATVSETPLFGCFSCGQCMAVCPEEAIEIEGRFLSKADIFPLPGKEFTTSFDELFHLLQHRRSVRDFKDKCVDPELILKIIEAAKTAPMGLPPSDVNILVMENKEQVRLFAKDFCDSLESMKWLTSNWFLTLIKPFVGKSVNDFFSGFFKPLIASYTGNMKKGINAVTYDAPAALYFYGSPLCDPADPIVAATYAMIAAESLGLATCMIGGVHPFTQKGSTAKKFREKQNIRYKSKEGLIVLVGYPKIKYKKGIKRSFANVDFAQ